MKLAKNIKKTLIDIAADGKLSERDRVAVVALLAHENGGPSPQVIDDVSAYLEAGVTRVRGAESALATELALHDVHFGAEALSVAWGSNPRSLWAMVLDRYAARPHVWEAAIAACGDDRDVHIADVQLAARRACFAYLAGALRNDADIDEILNVAVEEAMGRHVRTHKVEECDTHVNGVRINIGTDCITIYGVGGVEMEIRVVAAADSPTKQPSLCVGRSFDSADAPSAVADALAEEGFTSAANMLRFL